VIEKGAGLLTRIFGPKREEEDGENNILRSLVISSLHCMLLR
jgi:hypothetical protein